MDPKLLIRPKKRHQKRTLDQDNSFGAASDCRKYSPDEIAVVESELLSKAGEPEYWSHDKPKPKAIHKGGAIVSTQYEAQKIKRDKAARYLALVVRYKTETIPFSELPTAALLSWYGYQVRRIWQK
jgi:hypothetical protein